MYKLTGIEKVGFFLAGIVALTFLLSTGCAKNTGYGLYTVNCEGIYYKGYAYRVHVNRSGTRIWTKSYTYEYSPSVKCEVVREN